MWECVHEVQMEGNNILGEVKKAPRMVNGISYIGFGEWPQKKVKRLRI